MKKQILIIESDPNFFQIYQLNFMAYLECATEIARNEDEAKLKLVTQKFDLIVCRTKFLGTNLALAVLNFINEKKISTPFIALGSSKEDLSKFNPIHLTNGIKLKDIVKASGDALGITAQMMAKYQVEEYYPIPIHYFNFIHETFIDIYCDKNGKFEVIVPQFTDYPKDLLDKMQLNGEHFWYVKKDQRLKMVNYITSSMLAKIDFDTLDDDDQTSAQEVAQQLVSFKLKDFGVKEETVKLAKMAIKSMIKTTVKTKKIGDLIKRLNDNKASYLFKHVSLTTFFGFEFLQNVDWGNKEQQEKLAFTAFFHDICLVNDQQAKIHNQDELRKANLNPEDKELVTKHALMAAGFINEIPSAPMGVDQIIRQHHGTLNGIGFSEHYSANVSPLATVFMLSEEISKLLMDTPPGEDVKEILMKHVKEKFTTVRFKKYVEILEAMVI